MLKGRTLISKERTNLFCSAKKLICSVNFFPAKIFSGILEKGNLSEQEKILAGKKFTEQKRFSPKEIDQNKWYY
jgi:hypothetical protein